ncbi:hypothetical protein ADL26_11520, partial [Thermoactinomyces vulgaris]
YGQSTSARCTAGLCSTAVASPFDVEGVPVLALFGGANHADAFEPGDVLGPAGGEADTAVWFDDLEDDYGAVDEVVFVELG